MGHWHDGTNHVVHPDVSLALDLPEGYRHCFLEFERRAVTPKRIPRCLTSYRRYFASGWVERDQGKC